MQILGLEQYANAYILLTGPPGVGKSTAIREARVFMDRTGVHLSPERITREAFFEELASASQMPTINQETQSLDQTAAMSATIKEFNVFVSPRDERFMVDLTDIYDGDEKFHNKTKTKGENIAYNVCFNFLAGLTPFQIKNTFSENIFEQGFPARCLFIYSDIKPEYDDVFGVTRRKGSKLDGDLTHDLEIISMAKGDILWAPEAAKLLNEWNKGGRLPLPSDSRFEHYNTRRLTHLSKLCMMVALSNHDELLIDVDDYIQALDIMLSAEKFMPRAVAGIGENPLQAQSVAGMRFIIESWTKSKGKRAVPEYEVRRQMQRNVPLQYANYVIDSFVNNRWVQVMGDQPNRMFIPLVDLSELED